MATISAKGKPLGRPPGKKTATAAVVAVPRAPTAQEVAYQKAISHFKNRYDAAGNGRRLAGWKAPSSGPNLAMAGIQTIRNRARDVRRNDWSGQSLGEKWGTTLIGIGITPRFKGIKSISRRKKVAELFARQARVLDADGILDYFGMQTLAVLAWFDGGEVFIRRRNRFPDEGFPVPFQVQLLEAEMCPNDFTTETFEGLPVNHVIKQGIEFNKRGRRIAYWFYKEHPGENAFNLKGQAESMVRVAASQVSHMFQPERPGQLRGVPKLAPVLTRLRNIGDYQDTVLERQKIANLFVAFIKRSLPSLDPTSPYYQALTGLASDVVDMDTGAPLAPMSPGLMQELEDGQEVQFANPPEAGTTYSDYLRTEHLGTAAGAGMPYELMSGDIKDISDRAMRILINEFRRLAQQRQWQMVIPMLCQRVIEWFTEAAVLQGEVSISEINDVNAVEHSPHGWEHIHPVQDPQGKQIEVAAGFRSRSSVVAERGDDPDAVDEERAADQAREKRLGLPSAIAPAGTAGSGAAGGQGSPAEGEDGEDETEGQEANALVG